MAKDSPSLSDSESRLVARGLLMLSKSLARSAGVSTAPVEARKAFMTESVEAEMLSRRFFALAPV